MKPIKLLLTLYIFALLAAFGIFASRPPDLSGQPAFAGQINRLPEKAAACANFDAAGSSAVSQFRHSEDLSAAYKPRLFNSEYVYLLPGANSRFFRNKPQFYRRVNLSFA